MTGVSEKYGSNKSNHEEFVKQLLCSPLGCRVFGGVEVNELPTLMTEYDEYIERAKSGSGYREEVHRRQAICVVGDKCSPVQVEALSMPPYNGIRMKAEEYLAPALDRL